MKPDMASIQPKANDQTHGYTNSDEHALHHLAHRRVALGKFCRGIEFGEFVGKPVAHHHEADRDEATHNGVDEIGEDDAELRFHCLPLYF
jgi:hypothetical protein